MKRSIFSISGLLLSGLILTAEIPVYPQEYSGGFRRTIFVHLTLKSQKIYTYSEFTHAGYSVYDSGFYKIKDTTIVFNSLQTTHQFSRRRKRLANGEIRHMPDSVNRQKLFVKTSCSLHADTIVIWDRNVLFNREFIFGLVNSHRKS